MRLAVIFVITLAVSVIVSSTATWGLTFSTSYTELRDMSDGFVQLATLAVDNFAQLVWQLITDSGTLVTSILEEENNRTMTELNETQLQFLHTTIELMAQARNATTQAQSLVVALLVSFGDFIGTIINDFQVVGTDYASRLRTESASHAQANFNSMMQARIYSLKRQARLYEWGVLNLSRSNLAPQDEGSCDLFGLLCVASAEVQSSVFIGTLSGNLAFCDVTDTAYSVMVYPGQTSDNFILPLYPSYNNNDPTANITQWKSTCLGPINQTTLNVTCPHGVGMVYPDYCNGTCGFDSRCRKWYQVHLGTTVARTQMTDVYIDIHRKVPVVALSYPIFSGNTLVAAVGTDFFFDDVDKYLSTIGTGGNSQLVAVILNTSTFLVVGTNRGCANGTTTVSAGGVPIAQVCDPVLQGLSGWLAANRALSNNTSVELSGTLWDVFPSVVDTFTYFVAVGMNKSEVNAVVDATNQETNRTLQTLSRQQYARMAASENASLAAMDAVAAEKIAAIQAQQATSEQYAKQVNNQTQQLFIAIHQRSTTALKVLINDEVAAITKLKDHHVSQVVNNIGTTFGAVVGIFAGILLLGSYGTWIVTKQIQNITQTMEDVANMKVEELQVSQKSSVREVERIETALGILVLRLAEYKSYMPAGLFLQQQQQQEMPIEDPTACPISPSGSVGKRSLQSSSRAMSSPSHRRDSSKSTVDRRGTGPGTGGAARLVRRNVAVMAVNITHFQGDIAKRPAAYLETTLNRFISIVHRVASKAQGNIDTIVGDQVLVTFNAHFGCSDPPTTASTVALELEAAFRDELSSDLLIQIGLAAGPMYVGHLGYAQFKAMLAIGAPMKVASLLSHLSGFSEHMVLVCPSVAERIKYHFTLQPVDLVTLPTLGEHIALYDKSISVFTLLARASGSRGSQEWLYEIDTHESTGDWTKAFNQVAKAHSMENAKGSLEQYLQQHPEDHLARRLLHRMAYWQPRMGIVIAERPDVPHDTAGGSTHCDLSLSE